jgi:hypothetical protein
MKVYGKLILARHPERWSRATRNREPETVVWLNPARTPKQAVNDTLNAT